MVYFINMEAIFIENTRKNNVFPRCQVSQLIDRQMDMTNGLLNHSPTKAGLRLDSGFVFNLPREYF